MSTVHCLLSADKGTKQEWCQLQEQLHIPEASSSHLWMTGLLSFYGDSRIRLYLAKSQGLNESRHWRTVPEVYNLYEKVGIEEQRPLFQIINAEDLESTEIKFSIEHWQGRSFWLSCTLYMCTACLGAWHWIIVAATFQGCTESGAPMSSARNYAAVLMYPHIMDDGRSWS